MNRIINSVIDRHGHTYTLSVEIKKSSLKNFYDIRMYSRYSGANDPLAEQTKWKTTIPREAVTLFRDALSLELIDTI